MKRKKKWGIGTAIIGIAMIIVGIIVLSTNPILGMSLIFLAIAIIGRACYLFEKVIEANQTEK